QIMQRGFVAEMAERLPHLGEDQLGLITKTKQSFRAAKFFSGAGDLKDFVGCHCVRARLSGVAAEGAISAVVAAKVGKRNKNLARISNDAGLECFFCFAGGGQEAGE